MIYTPAGTNCADDTPAFIAVKLPIPILVIITGCKNELAVLVGVCETRILFVLNDMVISPYSEIEL
jgi:hypothetical protein